MADTVYIQQMPVEVKRDCIVVNGKTYCEDSPMPTDKEFAVFLIVLVLIAVYAITAFKVYIKFFEYESSVKSQVFIGVAWFTPVIALILWLLIH